MWKDIPWYENLYQISDCGEWIISLWNWLSTNSKKRIMSINFHRKWYPLISLSKNWKQSTMKVHRIVAKAFIPNPDNLPIVLHLDNNPLNYTKENLKWGTIKDNVQQMWNDNRWVNNICVINKWKILENSRNAKIVHQYSKEWIFIKKFLCIKSAHIETGVSMWNISSCCQWKLKSAGGYTWQY